MQPWSAIGASGRLPFIGLRRRRAAFEAGLLQSQLTHGQNFSTPALARSVTWRFLRVDMQVADLL